MRVIQAVGSFSRGDGIGNHIWELHKLFCREGYTSEIYSQYQGVGQEGVAGDISRLRDVGHGDVLILHMCIGSMVNKYVLRFPCRKVMVYHNITPPEFFKDYDVCLYRLCRRGYRELGQLAGRFDVVAAMSGYNRQGLLAMGYRDPVHVLPGYLVPLDDYREAPDPQIVQKYRDGKRNFLFVGRVVPNKRHEDVIRAFAYYQRHVDPETRLILVGSTGLRNYVADLERYVRMVGARDVTFTGGVGLGELIGYYNVADVFLCMSEHEGFCIPLIEAMLFGVPVVAYGAAAVPDTMGQAGVLMDTKDPAAWARVVERVLDDGDIRKGILEAGHRRVEELIRKNKNFSYSELFRE